MGVHSLKKHFNIKHTVQIRDGEIHIGSGYVSDLITISFNGEVKGNKTFMPFKNDDLERYYKELTEQSDTVKMLIEQDDTFDSVLPVYTYKNGRVLKKYCTEYGYPNVTTDGELMYDNTFFQNRGKAKETAKREAKYAVISCAEVLKVETMRFSKRVYWFFESLFHYAISFLQ